MNAFLAALVETFIRPFADGRRCLSYLGVFCGVFGFNLILIAMPLGSMQGGYTALLTFYLALFASMGLVFAPLFYTLSSIRDGKAWRVCLVLIQLACFLPLWLGTSSLLFQGVLCGLISTVFWGTYHIALRDNTTAEKRGYQVVLGDNLAILASALAAWITVHYVRADQLRLVLVIACLSMLSSNILQSIVSPFYYDSKLHTFLAKSLVTYRQQKTLIVRILQRSFLSTPDFILPAALYFLNYSVAFIGTIMILRTVVQTFLSPVIATLIQKRDINEYLLGFILCATAWLSLYAAEQSAVALAVFLILNATGLRLLNNSITVRLYGIGNYSGLMLSEFFLGLSRIAMLGMLIPLLYWNADVYIFFLVTLSVILIIGEWFFVGLRRERFSPEERLAMLSMAAGRTA